jgi:hypothetical protein
MDALIGNQALPSPSRASEFVSESARLARSPSGRGRLVQNARCSARWVSRNQRETAKAALLVGARSSRIGKSAHCRRSPLLRLHHGCWVFVPRSADMISEFNGFVSRDCSAGQRYQSAVAAFVAVSRTRQTAKRVGFWHAPRRGPSFPVGISRRLPRHARQAQPTSAAWLF